MSALRRHEFSSRSPEAVQAWLRAIERICLKRGLKFTENRSIVLKILLEANQPMRAYQLMNALVGRRGRKVSPPTLYRALEFLTEHGFVSRIETANAFAPSMHPDHERPCALFICGHCGSVAEIENKNLEALFDRDTASLGFRIAKRVIELQGTCAGCQTTEATTDRFLGRSLLIFRELDNWTLEFPHRLHRFRF